MLPSGQPNYSEPRPFGGINTFLFGDFWQIPPTGQIAIMSNPYSQQALESAAATGALSMFWKARSPDALQPWQLPNQPRVLHLNINYRSKQDVWFSHILDQCRLGDLSLTHYNYLHGFPTEHCGSWVHDELLLCNNETCRAFHRNITDAWNNSDEPWYRFWSTNHSKFECRGCQKERQRRKRVIGCQEYGGLSPEAAAELLASKTFATSVYITEYNQPVCLYAQVRALMFARHHKHQLFWIQAEDIPPSTHFSDHTSNELQELKKK